MNTNVRLMHVLVLENCKIIFLGRKCHLPYDVSVLPSMRLERDWEVNYPSKWSHFCWCSFSSSINSIDKPFRENERWKPDAQITLAFFAFLPWFYRVFTNITSSCVQNLLGHPVSQSNIEIMEIDRWSEDRSKIVRISCWEVVLWFQYGIYPFLTISTVKLKSWGLE